jgi:hypothetical protein
VPIQDVFCRGRIDVLATRGEHPACVDVSDTGTELTSVAVLRRAKERGLEWHYIAPGKPQQNAIDRVVSLLVSRSLWLLLAMSA